MIKQFEIGPMQNFCYLIGDEDSKKAFILDPAWQPDTIFKTVEENGFTLAGLIISHAHYDHTNAILDILKKTDVPVYAHPEEITYSKSGVSIVGKLGSTVKAVQGGDKIKLGQTEIEFLHTPGHTPGSQCVKVGNALMTGDTLFIGGCGRADLPGGDLPTLTKSLSKIAKLPADLILYPGHDYGFVQNRSLMEEVKDNPYLKNSA